MICPKCRTENPQQAKVCLSCAAPLSDSSAQVPIQQTKRSGLAIASLVLGIAGFFICIPAVVTSIIGLALGIIAVVKINKSQGLLSGKGMAIAGIVTSVASLLFAILCAILCTAILLPALGRVRQTSRRANCTANLRQLGLAIRMYAEDNSDQYPTADKWCDLIKPYIKNEQVFVCTEAKQGPCSYAMNKGIEVLSTTIPPDAVLLFETEPGWNRCGGPELLSCNNHNGQGCGILFDDGHTQFVQAKDIESLNWTGKKD